MHDNYPAPSNPLAVDPTQTQEDDFGDANARRGLVDRTLRFGGEDDLMNLFDRGMDINQTDYQGRTPLMMCAVMGKRAAFETLLKRGADVDAIYMHQDRIPNTALDAAIQTGSAEMADLLRAHGAMVGRDLKRAMDDAESHGAQYLNLHSTQFTTALAEAPVYRKMTVVSARLAQKGEQVVTVTPDGVEEGRKTAEQGDYVVTGANGADFILSAEKFNKLYEQTDEEGRYRAKGMARIIDNPTGEKIGIMAPWGEMQYGSVDAKIAVQYDPNNPDVVGTDRYILDSNEFVVYAPINQ
jgi:hypothetical protein